MSLSARFIALVQKVLPNPLALAILLTLFTYVLALFLTASPKPFLEVLDQNGQSLVQINLEQQTTASFQQAGQELGLAWADNSLSIKNKVGELVWRGNLQIKTNNPLTTSIKLPKKQGLELRQKAQKTPYFLALWTYWQGGFFKFLAFSMQMMLILVLGHVAALSRPANWLLERFTGLAGHSGWAVFAVALSSMLLGLFNWGFALIFSAVLVRKLGEAAAQKGQKIHYPLLGAAAYSCMLIWHAGLSGSAPLKIAEEGHEMAEQMGVIPIGQTLLSSLNLWVLGLSLAIIPAVLGLLGHFMRPPAVQLPQKPLADRGEEVKLEGAARLDQWKPLAWGLGALMLFLALYQALILPIWVQKTGFDWQFRFLNPNFLIFVLFGMAFLLHGRLSQFQQAVGQAIGGSSGILIQFPFYAGIMGIMFSSGLVDYFSAAFVQYASPQSFPFFTLCSAALVNFFVPSGGGQWLVQGPILIESAQQLDVPLYKAVLALCYGDQWSNMLQPFWALPLLGITGLKAQNLLPYTFLLFLLGGLIFGACLFWG